VIEPGAWLERLRDALTGVAEPAAAPGMAAYQREQFEFLGVAAGARRQAQRPLLAETGECDGDAVLALADAAWSEPEREFHYCAVDLLRTRVRVLESRHLVRVEFLIRVTPWWDTVDALAVHVVGGLVARDVRLVEEMDRWIEVDRGEPADLWIRRAALLHQLMYKDDTDPGRLFVYCESRLDENDFFIRKAIGWALRQYARTDPVAVVDFVDEHRDSMSGLTRREALKHIG